MILKKQKTITKTETITQTQIVVQEVEKPVKPQVWKNLISEIEKKQYWTEYDVISRWGYINQNHRHDHLFELKNPINFNRIKIRFTDDERPTAYTLVQDLGEYALNEGSLQIGTIEFNFNRNEKNEVVSFKFKKRNLQVIARPFDYTIILEMLYLAN